MGSAEGTCSTASVPLSQTGGLFLAFPQGHTQPLPGCQRLSHLAAKWVWGRRQGLTLQ